MARVFEKLTRPLTRSLRYQEAIERTRAADEAANQSGKVRRKRRAAEDAAAAGKSDEGVE